MKTQLINKFSSATEFAEEMRMFRHAHSDALLLEKFLEEAPFQVVKPFPFHFSNSRSALFFFVVPFNMEVFFSFSWFLICVDYFNFRPHFAYFAFPFK